MDLKNLGLQKLRLNLNDDIIETVFAKEGDHKSRGLDVQILENNVVTDTTGVEVEFYAKPRDGEVYLVLAKEKDLKRGKYEIIYPTHILQPGPVKVEIKLVKGEQVISTKKFILEVENAISTDDIVEKSDERPLLAILVEAAKNEKSRIEAENKRVVAEGKRVETENQREKNESQRKSTESQRQKNEEERKSNESKRQSNESTRQVQENKRNEAENKRAANEESRKGSEATRRIDENRRVAAENERVKSESTRKSNENTRVANETKREQNRKIVEGWIKNPSQFNGKNLEFHWNGTKLGVRLKGDSEYKYVNLKGDTGPKGEKGDRGVQGIQGPKGDRGPQGQKGDSGDIGSLTAEQVIRALNYQPATAKEANMLRNDVNNLDGDIGYVEDVLGEHVKNTKNPHNITAEQIGAATKKELGKHLEEYSYDIEDIHQVTDSLVVQKVDRGEFEKHIDGPFHIVESGSNSNGKYIKFADGTLICYKPDLVLEYTDNMSNYRDKTWCFPITFIQDPMISVSPPTPHEIHFNMRLLPPIVLNHSSDMKSKRRIVQYASLESKFVKGDYLRASVMAIGRWK